MSDVLNGPVIDGPRYSYHQTPPGSTVDLEPVESMSSITELAAAILSGQAHIVGGMFDSAGNGPVMNDRTRQKVRACRMLAAELVRQEREDAVPPTTQEG